MAFKPDEEPTIEIFTNTPSTAKRVFRPRATPAKLVIQQPKVDYQSGGEGADLFMSISGIDALVATLRAMPQVAKDAAGFEMADIAHEIIEDAKANYVPWETGELRDSGNADEYTPNSGAEITEIKMWFGQSRSESANAAIQAAILVGDLSGAPRDPSEYAEIQHEDMLFKHPRGGGPKYLEIPFNKVLNTIVPRIASKIFESWGGGASEVSPRFVEYAFGKPEIESSVGK